MTLTRAYFYPGEGSSALATAYRGVLWSRATFLCGCHGRGLVVALLAEQQAEVETSRHVGGIEFQRRPVLLDRSQRVAHLPCDKPRISLANSYSCLSTLR